MGQPRLSEWQICSADSGRYLTVRSANGPLNLGLWASVDFLVARRAGKFAAGVELFYLEIARQSLKRQDLALAWRLQPKSQWGRRAEDPFRGLRAGPVRYSPFTFADRRAGYASGPR